MREWLKAMNGEDYDYRKMVKSRVALGKAYMILGVLEILVMCLVFQGPGEYAGNFYLFSGLAVAVCGGLIVEKTESYCQLIRKWLEWKYGKRTRGSAASGPEPGRWPDMR